MRMFKRIKARGFTLVELMIVVAIIGVLAALAIYGVRRYLSSAKSAEARNTIGAVNRGAVASYERENAGSELVAEGQLGTQANHALCTSAAKVPVAGVPAGKKYQPNTAAGQDFNAGTPTQGWVCLRFSMNEAHYYQYNYSQGTPWAKPAGSPAIPATGWESGAIGDLDGDGIFSKFSSGGDVNSTTKEVKVFTHIAEENADELSARPSRGRAATC